MPILLTILIQKITFFVIDTNFRKTIDTPQNRQSMPDADFSTWAKPE